MLLNNVLNQDKVANSMILGMDIHVAVVRVHIARFRLENQEQSVRVRKLNALLLVLPVKISSVLRGVVTETAVVLPVVLCARQKKIYYLRAR